MKKKAELFLLTLGVILVSNFLVVKGSKAKYVTYNSLIKLLNDHYNVRLHSHDVKYGSGSGQQSVTATEVKEDINSHWTIKAAYGKESERGQPVKCGDKIRLEHLSTKKNLHSHYFTSPLSGEQEISCYGNDGEGDTGDNWEVICSGDYWDRKVPINLRHMDTGVYLGVSGRSFGRPISGQMEVVGYHSPVSSTKWTTAEGLYILSKDSGSEYQHTEL